MTKLMKIWFIFFGQKSFEKSVQFLRKGKLFKLKTDFKLQCITFDMLYNASVITSVVQSKNAVSANINK